MGPQSLHEKKGLTFVNEPLRLLISRPLNSLFIHEGLAHLQGSQFYNKWNRRALLWAGEDPALEDVRGGEDPLVCHSRGLAPSAAHPERSVPVSRQVGRVSHAMDP